MKIGANGHHDRATDLVVLAEAGRSVSLAAFDLRPFGRANTPYHTAKPPPSENRGLGRRWPFQPFVGKKN